MSPHERLTVFLAEHRKGISYLPEEVEESKPQEEGTIAHKPATCSTRRPRGEGEGEGRRGGGGGQKEGRGRGTEGGEDKSCVQTVLVNTRFITGRHVKHQLLKQCSNFCQ